MNCLFFVLLCAVLLYSLWVFVAFVVCFLFISFALLCFIFSLQGMAAKLQAQIDVNKENNAVNKENYARNAAENARNAAEIEVLKKRRFVHNNRENKTHSIGLRVSYSSKKQSEYFIQLFKSKPLLKRAQVLWEKLRKAKAPKFKPQTKKQRNIRVIFISFWAFVVRFM